MILLTDKSKEKIEALIAKMTLEEKVGQLNQLSPSIVGGFDVPFEELIEMVTEGRISQDEFNQILSNAEMDYKEEDIRSGRISSFLLNNPQKANELQKIAVEESRLGIPLIFGFDIIHGHNTVFPIPLAEACSWDETLFKKTARVAAYEARRAGINWTFAPMLDISRDARWGRISESAGEDPYLASRYGLAKVKGYQVPDEENTAYIASCLKHFAAYGAAESGQDYNSVSLAESLLQNVYLKPFKGSVEAGAATVMASFNDINGIPCTSNQKLLRKTLKEDFGFEGFVVSDANAIRETIIHGYAHDGADAAVKAIKAGLDMDMGTSTYINQLPELVTSGKVSLSELDEAVRRILTIKMQLDLFDKPYVDESLMTEGPIVSDKNRKLALEAAEKSIVLLKNKGILPLSVDAKVALVGKLADMKSEVLGAWALAGKEKDCISIRDGFDALGVSYNYGECVGPTGDFDEATFRSLTEGIDTVVAVVGELSSMSGEASSRADISLPGQQEQMLKKAVELGKKVVVLLMNGRPMAIPWIKEHADAVVELWQLGIEHGNAAARVIYGYTNPTGKLCVTFPSMTGQCPRYYNHFSTGRPAGKGKFTSRYLDAPIEDLFPFGFGLSYTEYEYSDLRVQQTKDNIQVKVLLKNTGNRSGVETVQVYMRDCFASLVRPVKELVSFKKVFLESKEETQLSFQIPLEQLGFYDNDGNYLKEDGSFIFYVGGSSVDCLEEEIGVCF